MQVGWKYYILSTSWHKLLNIQYLQFQQIPLEKRVSCYAPILCRKQSLSVLTVERGLRDHYQLSLKTTRKQFTVPHHALWSYNTCYLCYLCYSVWNSNKRLIRFLEGDNGENGQEYAHEHFLEFKKNLKFKMREACPASSSFEVPLSSVKLVIFQLLKPDKFFALSGTPHKWFSSWNIISRKWWAFKWQAFTYSIASAAPFWKIFSNHFI